MKKIKFRAWSKRRNKWVSPMTSFSFVTADLTTEFKDTEEISYSQYTGLKDKNGKEIYEEDILRFSNGNIGKVFWSNLRSGFDVAFNGAIPEELDVRLADRSEVVGNIYKNKELLDE